MKNKKEKKLQWDEIDLPEYESLVSMLTVDEPALTTSQVKVLACRLHPQSLFMSVDQKARLAGVGTRTWYRHERSSEYREALRRQIKNIIPTHILAEVIQRLGHKAANGDGPSIKLFLEYCGEINSQAVTTQFNVALINTKRNQRMIDGLAKFGYRVVEQVEDTSAADRSPRETTGEIQSEIVEETDVHTEKDGDV